MEGNFEINSGREAKGKQKTFLDLGLWQELGIGNRAIKGNNLGFGTVGIECEDIP